MKNLLRIVLSFGVMWSLCSCNDKDSIGDVYDIFGTYGGEANVINEYHTFTYDQCGGIIDYETVIDTLFSEDEIIELVPLDANTFILKSTGIIIEVDHDYIGHDFIYDNNGEYSHELDYDYYDVLLTLAISQSDAITLDYKSSKPDQSTSLQKKSTISFIGQKK